MIGIFSLSSKSSSQNLDNSEEKVIEVKVLTLNNLFYIRFINEILNGMSLYHDPINTFIKAKRKEISIKT
ncbi:hypothetical protein GCM10007290_23450 [Providencia stuartii]|nr:hypothetical protein GCM10007290_23450 [Providencia thailandensis]